MLRSKLRKGEKNPYDISFLSIITNSMVICKEFFNEFKPILKRPFVAYMLGFSMIHMPMWLTSVPNYAHLFNDYSKEILLFSQVAYGLGGILFIYMLYELFSLLPAFALMLKDMVDDRPLAMVGAYENLIQRNVKGYFGYSSILWVIGLSIFFLCVLPISMHLKGVLKLNSLFEAFLGIFKVSGEITPLFFIFFFAAILGIIFSLPLFIFSTQAYAFKGKTGNFGAALNMFKLAFKNYFDNLAVFLTLGVMLLLIVFFILSLNSIVSSGVDFFIEMFKIKIATNLSLFFKMFLKMLLFSLFFIIMPFYSAILTQWYFRVYYVKREYNWLYDY